MSTKTKKIRPPAKCFGGKSYLAPWIISQFPENYREMTYVEPFCGMASVTLQKERSKEEILNDLDPSVYALLFTVQNDCDFLVEELQKMKYREASFEEAKRLRELDQHGMISMSAFALALNEYTLRRMSRGGMRKDFAWSERLRGGIPGDVNAWNTAIGQLPAVAARLQDASILCSDSLRVIRANNKKSTLVYCDPPYLKSTRTSPDVYQFEYTEHDHKQLALLLKRFKGKVVLSGYDSALYRQLYAGWRMEVKATPNHSGQTKKKQSRIECLWINY